MDSSQPEALYADDDGVLEAWTAALGYLAGLPFHHLYGDGGNGDDESEEPPPGIEVEVGNLPIDRQKGHSRSP